MAFWLVWVMSKRGPKIRSLIIFEIRTWSRAPRREPTLRWRISLFLFKSASPKKKFSTAGSDAAVGNLVFSIKKRFPEKHNVFHGRIRRCDGKSRFFYLKAFPRKKKYFPPQDLTLWWKISFFFYLKAFPKEKRAFSTAAFDAAVENLVFSI